MTPKCGSKQPGAFKYHDGEMVDCSDIGDGAKMVRFVCLRCGHRWVHEYFPNNTMTEYDDESSEDESKSHAPARDIDNKVV